MNRINGSKAKTKKVPKTMVYTGNSELETKITHYRYDTLHFESLSKVEKPSPDHNDMIVVEGFQNKDKLLELSKEFEINDFYVEDIFNVTQRNKFEITENQVFIVLKYAVLNHNILEFRRIYFVLKKGLVMIFTDYENNYVKLLIERINNKVAMFPAYDESYIVYAIYDIIIDEQLEMTRSFKLTLEELETTIMESDITHSRDLFLLHKQFVQLRNNINSMSDNVSPKEVLQSMFFTQELIPFSSDLEDHIYNLKERLHTNIELCNSLITMYSTQISNKTNEVMKTLTIISVIFIPLSFIAGVFGMNFAYFDILQNQYGLFIFGILSLMIAVGMLIWFKLRKWM